MCWSHLGVGGGGRLIDQEGQGGEGPGERAGRQSEEGKEIEKESSMNGRGRERKEGSE